MKKPSRLSGVVRLGTAVLAMTAVAVTSAGCGEGASKGTTSGNPQLTKSEIKLGLLISRTGPSSASDKIGADVAEAWAQWVNDNGGLSGHPVKMVIKDDRGDGATAIAAAKELVADQGVLALTSQTSATETASAGYLKGQDIAVVGAVGYSAAVWGALPNYFSTVPAGFPTDVLAQFVSARAVNAKRWAVASCAEQAACKQSEPIWEPASKQQQVQFAGSISVSTSSPSYTAECLQLKNSEADFIQISFSPASAKRFVSDCKAQGYDGWFGATAGTVSPHITGIKGIRLAGGLHGFPWWADSPKAAVFRDTMEKHNSDVEYETPAVTAMWASLELIRKALTSVGDSPTRQDVFNGLYQLVDEDLGGLLPQKMTYTKEKPAPTVLCAWLYRLEDGNIRSAALPEPSGNSAGTGDLKTNCVTPLG